MTANEQHSTTPNQDLPLKSWKFALKGLEKSLSQLGIRAKIGAGYAIALSIAVLGSSAGIVIGNYYQHRALELSHHTKQELQLLYRLQVGILQARTHQQQFIPLLEHPNSLKHEYSHFLHHEAEVKTLWRQLQASIDTEEHGHEAHTTLIPAYVERHSNNIDVYFQQVESLVGQIYHLSLNRDLELDKYEHYENQLLALTNSSVALKFDETSDELVDLIQVSYEEHEVAEANLVHAEQLRNYISAISMMLSIAIAILLAIYTSRTIARPIVAVTKVAKQATEESNFDLQAPVTTTDEIGTLAVSLNQLIQRVKYLLEEQQAEASRQLIQSEKMSSLGRMIAGVAHEINNPINFIYGNLSHANAYIDDLLDLLHLYIAETPRPSATIQEKSHNIDLEFIEEDLPKILQSIQVGADRARQIILSLKNFSRLDEADAHLVDIHACLDSTLMILNNRLKKGIAIVRDYGELPLVEGYSGSLYQVFMNLLSNAIEALEEQDKLQSAAQITITTRRSTSELIQIEIADNGAGIAPEHQAKIFDTFFTTKPRGIGTGLGLSISRQIVEEKHGGTLAFNSKASQGTIFSITLPIHQSHRISSGAQCLSPT